MAVIRMKEKVNVSKHLCRYCRHRMQCLTETKKYAPCASLGKYNTIDDAMQNAEAGETIYVEPGVYHHKTINFTKDNITMFAEEVTFNSCAINMNETHLIEGNNTSFLSCAVNVEPLINKKCVIDTSGNTGVINYNGNPGNIIGCTISESGR